MTKMLGMRQGGRSMCAERCVHHRLRECAKEGMPMSQSQFVSPVPGIFFRCPSPDKPPFKEVGDPIAPGEVVCLVEVMKTFYEVRAETSGSIVRFLVEDGDSVEVGQPLADVDG
jgi:acetyl-CoA carboxylase biotin carboxyl carrier protein